jgi:hypothetical protein
MGLRVGEPDACDLQDALEHARLRYPVSGKPPDWTLTMSHARRHLINRQRNLALRPKTGSIYVRWKPKCRRQADDPQSFFCWPGLTLIGSGGKVPRGILVKVVDCSEEEVTLDCGVTLSLEELVRCVRPCSAITYASCQGLTLPGRVLLETASTHITLRHLYVGCSRATSYKFLEVQ